MTYEERIQKIKEAIDVIEEARAMVSDAVYDTDQRPHYEAYGKYGFRTLLGEGNPYNYSLHSLIRDFQSKITERDLG